MAHEPSKLLNSLLVILLVAVAAVNGQQNGLSSTKGRDEKAVEEALQSWWTASMKTHERRISWWRQSEFGCFIHWGVYSTFGGEWKGKPFRGYAEHMMRSQKIPRSEYLEKVVSVFNPVKFDAEEWIRLIKAAGMKYVIITAKHHDGFAMYPSTVSPYNIRDATVFKRDPMRELAAAARKHGLRFGFYYSHAFDWEHPDAPGNDWDYDNPGGDKGLHGGVQWYDHHTELLAKARKYVDEKAIPQIVEFDLHGTGLRFGDGKAPRAYVFEWRDPVRRVARVAVLSLLLPISSAPLQAQTKSGQTIQSAAPRVFLLDAKHLRETRARILANDRSVAAAIQKLESDAHKALETGPFSVVTKETTPPSGDKHDYMSQAPYFWPDPKTPGGLPYIRKDGERNPEINKISDHRSLDQMVASVETLALAYYFKGNEAYAVKAVQLLRAFFLDPATRMNPNLQFAQAIPGVNTGRGIGLIETRGLTRVVDAVGLLSSSKALTKIEQRGLEEWFSKFLRWMIESKNGRDEAAARNNHGTYYDLQVASFALFLGRKEFATDTLLAARQKRIAVQIEPDGRQPLELVRTKAWGYSVGNLDGLMQLARLGESVGVDLWNYKTADGRSIRCALDYLVPFAFGEEKWAYQQLGEWPPQMLFPLVRRAAARYGGQRYQSLMVKIPRLDAADRSNLLRSSAMENSQAQR